MARPPSTQPTDGELAILGVLWDDGPCELGQVRAGLQGRGRSVAATTVATMLKVMLDKGLVRRAEGPRGYLWSARASRKATSAGLLRKLIDHAFDGSASRLVAHMIEEGKLSDDDRQAIRRMLEEHDAEEGGPRP